MAKRKIIIIGAGGHAKVLINSLFEQNLEILGIVDADSSKLGESVLGIKIIGNDDVIQKYSVNDIYLVNGIGSVASLQLRKQIYQNFTKMGYLFMSIIDQNARIARDVHIGSGVQIMAGAIVQPGCSIGENTIINTRVSIDHDCFIGDNVHIAPGAVLSGNVTVGSCTHLGTSCTVIQGINIGSKVLVAAAALVIHDVTTGLKVCGIPAKEMMKIGKLDGM